MDELEKVQKQLTDAIADVGRPLDEAHAALTEVEQLVERAGEHGAKVVAIVVSVVNTGKVEAGAHVPPPAEGPAAGTTALPQPLAGPVSGTTDASQSLEGSVSGEVSAEAVVSAEATLVPELATQAEALGQKLRTVLSELEATPTRLAALGTAVKDVVLQVPPLAVEATATAQIDIANPFASAEAKAQAQANITRINAVVQTVQKSAREIQAKVVSLPPKALALIAKAQTVLLGATLKPPPPDNQKAVAFQLSGPQSKEGGAPSPVASDEPASRGVQWGWYLAGGLTAGIAITGTVMYASSNDQVGLCESPSGYGCSNLDALQAERDWGLVLLSLGSGATLSLITAGAVINSSGDDHPEQPQAKLACSPGGLGLSCRGRF